MKNATVAARGPLYLPPPREHDEMPGASRTGRALILIGLALFVWAAIGERVLP